MVKKYNNEDDENSQEINIRMKLYKIRLEDLQQYFDYNVFYFDKDYEDEDYEDEDYEEALIRQYEEQALRFLRSIGARVSIDTFLTICNDIVYVREVPPGIIPIQG